MLHAADCYLAISPGISTRKTSVEEVIAYFPPADRIFLIICEDISSNATLVTARSIFLTPPRLVELLEMLKVFYRLNKASFMKLDYFFNRKM